MDEIWKDVVGYEGLYQVSNLGRVKSLNYRRKGIEHVLKPAGVGAGYLGVSLSKNRKAKQIRVHRLVAIAFLDNPERFPEINHKDEDKKNNCADNLEWCNRKYNMNYGSMKVRLSSGYNCCKVYCVELGETFKSAAHAERKTKASNSHILKCCKKIRKTAGGYHWRYAEA